MAESLVSEWLDENRYRAFPLKEGGNRTDGSFSLSDEVILDAYFNTPVDAPVELLSIEATTEMVLFSTTYDVFIVERPLASDDITITTESGSKLTLGVALNDIPNGTYDFTGVVFEDSVCVHYNAPWNGVSSVDFGGSLPMSGDIHVFPCVHTYLSTKNNDTLIWTVGKNRGTPADNCLVYGDLPDDCGEQVSFINGIPANGTTKQFKINTSGGVKVVSDTENNRLLVSLVFDSGNICPPIPPTT